jgi:hypothetical protein
MVNLTALAPDIVAAILDETLRSELTLFDLAVDPPTLWGEQRRRILSNAAPQMYPMVRFGTTITLIELYSARAQTIPPLTIQSIRQYGFQDSAT